MTIAIIQIFIGLIFGILIGRYYDEFGIFFKAVINKENKK